ncbi:MAG: hypothetical protein LBN08_07855 [Lactobacillales bacterium]|nr:hypothetical protein [Lactobacillales bacterium]
MGNIEVRASINYCFEEDDVDHGWCELHGTVVNGSSKKIVVDEWRLKCEDAENEWSILSLDQDSTIVLNAREAVTRKIDMRESLYNAIKGIEGTARLVVIDKNEKEYCSEKISLEGIRQGSLISIKNLEDKYNG